MKKLFLLISICVIILTACASKDSLWQEQYDLGIRYLNEGNYAEAIIAFTAAIEIDENNIEAYRGMANAYIKQNDYQKALEILRELEVGYEGTIDTIYSDIVVTLYQPDKQQEFDIRLVDKMLNDGWYSEPVCYIYSLDGDAKVVLISEIESYKADGWYTEKVYQIFFDANGGLYAPDTLVKFHDTATAIPSDLPIFGNRNFLGWSISSEDTETEYLPGDEYAANETITLYAKWEPIPYKSGMCGNNISWILDTDGVLTISGTGRMENYKSFSNSPWYKMDYPIKKIIINEGVTGIGDRAFYSLEDLVSAVFPESLEKIGAFSFIACRNLGDIYIPKNVNEIGEGAFCACNGISFITVDAENKYYVNDENGTLYNIDKTQVIDFPEANTSVIELNVPDGITDIQMYAYMDMKNMKKAVLPNTLKTIGYEAFSYCVDMESVYIPSSVTDIDDTAFEKCENLTIYAPAGSYAQIYASKRNIPFVAS